MNSSLPFVFVVVLNWNNAPDTIQCLASVFGQGYPNYSVVVVDNGSTDNSVYAIKMHAPSVTLIETKDNLGYAEGNDIGIRYALYNRARCVVYAPVMESFGLVPLEAMACSTPVAGIREGGVRETVVHGPTGLLTDRDSEQFAGAIMTLLEDRSLREIE